MISRNKKFTGLDSMRSAGVARGIGVPSEPPSSSYYSVVPSLPVHSKNPITYGIYKN